MSRHQKNMRFLLTGLLIAVFTLGTAVVGIFASQVSNEFQVSAIKSQGKKLKKTVKRKVKKKVKRKRGSARSLTAQLETAVEHPEPTISCISAVTENPVYKGEFIQRETKQSAALGKDIEVSLFLKNTGNIPWFGDTSHCLGTSWMRLGTARERDRSSIFYKPGDSTWITTTRIAMVEPRVEPGEIATFTFRSKAPGVTDIFREYFQPVVEGKQWIDSKEATAWVDISVGMESYLYENSLKYMNATGQASSIDTSAPLRIDVDISEQKMLVLLGEQIIREYTVSSGTFKTPTPLGTFKILNKQELRIGNKWPHYHMPYWQGFTQWGHGLHSLPYLANDKGTFWNEALNHIGQRVSHGCIRMLPDDSADLYSLTELGSEMVIHE